MTLKKTKVRQCHDVIYYPRFYRLVLLVEAAMFIYFFQWYYLYKKVITLSAVNTQFEVFYLSWNH